MPSPDLKRFPNMGSLLSEKVNMKKTVKGKKHDKVKKSPPRQPSTKELSKMSIKEIADLIIQTRDALWPSGGGDSEQIPGLRGVGAEDSR